MSRAVEWHLFDDLRAPRIPSPPGAWERLRGTRADFGRGDYCLSQHNRGNLCARSRGHKGRHASYGPTHVVAVWL